MNCAKPKFPDQSLSFFESILVTLERWSRGETPMRGGNVIDDPGNRPLKAPDVVKTLAWMLPKAQAAYRDLEEFLHVYDPPLGGPKWCATPTPQAAEPVPVGAVSGDTKRLEPDLCWDDADNETFGHGLDDIADTLSTDMMPGDETIAIIECALALPKRKIHVWIEPRDSEGHAAMKWKELPLDAAIAASPSSAGGA